jgi:uncharacterized membrane protein
MIKTNYDFHILLAPLFLMFGIFISNYFDFSQNVSLSIGTIGMLLTISLNRKVHK